MFTYMIEGELIPEETKRAFILHHLQGLLNTIVRDYSDTAHKTREHAQEVTRSYAIAVRDYWDNNQQVSDAKALRQIWTDALVKVATANDWAPMKMAVQFDILSFNESPSPINQQRSKALENVVRLL